MQKFLLGFILVIFVLHTLGNAFNWYWTFPWYDIPMHMMGGAFVAVVFLYLFGEKWRGFDIRSNFRMTLVFGLGFVALIGVGWEMYEYLSAVYLQNQYALTCGAPGGVFNSLMDLFNDLLGAALALLIWKRIDKKKSRE